jgi:hypothetical protein
MSARGPSAGLVPFEEIAAELGIDERSVRRDLASALRKFRVLDPDLDTNYFSSVLSGLLKIPRRFSIGPGESGSNAERSQRDPTSRATPSRRGRSAGCLSDDSDDSDDSRKPDDEE